jgi:hypothetical protein
LGLCVGVAVAAARAAVVDVAVSALAAVVEVLL